MSIRKTLAMAMLALSLGGCATIGQVTGESATAVVERSYSLRAFQFSAPDDLSVSESDGYYPVASVVWRGDIPGDRIAQIGALFDTAAARNRRILKGAQPVIADVQLIRFHGVTEKTRYSYGGVYNVVFSLTVLDAATGDVIEGPRRIKANLDAPGGSQAVALELSGQTEKVRMTDFLTSVLNRELTTS